MRKALAVCVLALLPAPWSPAWGDTPSVRKEASGNKKQNRALGQAKADPTRGTKESPLVVDTTGHVQTPEETAKQKADERYKALIDGWTLGSAIAGAVFSGVLVCIGFFGVRAANNTLRQIRRQANFMNRQIRLQEADMMRFVSVYPAWDVWTEDDPFLSRKIIRASIPLQNQGDSPISVYVVLTFGGDIGLMEAFRFESGVAIDIQPRNRQVITARIPVPDLWLELYSESSGIRIPVEFTIRHGGVLDTNGPVTTFSGKLECGQAMNNSYFSLDPVRMVPALNWRKEDAEPKQNPK